MGFKQERKGALQPGERTGSRGSKVLEVPRLQASVGVCEPGVVGPGKLGCALTSGD
jgi:hypothetical protein